MMHRRCGIAALTFIALVAAPAAKAEDAGRMVIIPAPGSVKWGPAPPNLPSDVQLSVLSGDPSKPGPFVLRVKTTAHSQIMPHTHPTPENLTIISGSLFHGMGKTFDKTKGEKVSAGGFVYLPANMPHYLWGDEAAEIQVTGTGPFTVDYINPSDDPSHKK